MGDVLKLAVVSKRKKRGQGGGGDQLWLKRLAIQIAAQLPEKKEDALMVLILAERIVREFMMLD